MPRTRRSHEFEQEIHDNNYENHAGERPLAHKAINQGYYWTKMIEDAKDYVKRCPNVSGLSRFRTNLGWISIQYEVHGPSCKGLDMVDPLLYAQPQFRFLLFATDFFTEWIKAVPLSDVTRQQIVKFIVCHFRLPHTITSDNGTTFASLQVMSFCSKCKITH